MYAAVSVSVGLTGSECSAPAMLLCLLMSVLEVG